MPARADMMDGRKHAPVSLGAVLVLGLGVSGRAACDYCLGLLGGRVSSLAVYTGDTDVSGDGYVRRLAQAGAQVVSKDLAVRGSYDLCIASPGISEFDPFYLSAAHASAEVISEVEFAWRESRSEAVWVAVSGTNGKTTTTALIAHILEECGFSAAAVGNIGDTCLEAVATDAADILVAETSSYQLASTRLFAPDVAVLLNITPDHLAWHGSFEAYVAAKMKLFDNMGSLSRATAVLDATDEQVRTMVRRIKPLSREARGFDYIPVGTAAGLASDMRAACGSDHAAFLDGSTMHVAFAGTDYELGLIDDLQIRGNHNAANALAAASSCLCLGADAAGVSAGLRSFAPLEHRIEPCGSVAGVLCYNDSKATNIDATCKALGAFGETPLIVLLGGCDKGTDLAALVDAVERHCKAAVCFGAASARFSEALADTKVKLRSAATLEEALDEALSLADAGDAVVLSPACASFDEFESYAQRGRRFKAYVEERRAKRGD